MKKITCHKSREEIISIIQAYYDYSYFKGTRKKLIIGHAKKPLEILLFFRKNHLILDYRLKGWFTRFLFVLFLLLLGVIIPLIWYFTAIRPSAEKAENELAGLLENTA